MGKYSKEDYEFEKSKQAILALNSKKEKHPSVSELEIIEYRKRKQRESYMIFGATLGIISFVISSFLVVNLFLDIL